MADTQAPAPAPAPETVEQKEEYTTSEIETINKIKAGINDHVDKLTTVFDKLGRPNPGLDDKFYHLEEKEAEFLKQQTGIQDDEELKQHIIKVQAGAYAVHPYPCIRRFGFTKLKISRFPTYDKIIKLGKERPGALFLDIGCCFGNDLRKAVADGFPVEQAIASDLHPEFWDLGHELYRTTPESFPATFIPGDALDPNFISDAPPLTTAPTNPLPPLSSLTSLTPLQGRLSAIFAASFFHLFNEDKQLILAHRLASLLSPEPGSVIFGAHGGLPEKGWRAEATKVNPTDRHMWCHSSDSWRELWEKEVFKNGEVKVWTILVEVPRLDLLQIPEARFWMLVWSVTRV